MRTRRRGLHYIIMEYVDGVDLAALVQNTGPLPVGKAIEAVLQAAQGLEYAHSQGIIHRDIKPHNLLMDPNGIIKILDMGLARFEEDAAGDEGLTSTGVIMGTLDFMSPEQAVDTHTADARADIYSLGCTLFYLLGARPMYGGNSAVQKLLAHREQPIPALREACPTAPDVLDSIYRRMVAKNPTERYQTMTELIADLKNCRLAESDPSIHQNLLDTELRQFLQKQEIGETLDFLEQPLSSRPASNTSSTQSLQDTLDIPVMIQGKKSPKTRWIAAGVLGLVMLSGILIKITNKEWQHDGDQGSKGGQSRGDRRRSEKGSHHGSFFRPCQGRGDKSSTEKRNHH